MDWRQVEELFHAALEQDAARREAFVERACSGDAPLRDEVLALLRADSRTGAVLDLDLSNAPLARAHGADADVDLTGRSLGPWRIVRELGEGGMGKVWLGERADAAFEMKVAVKVIRAGLATGAVRARFLAERRTLARLDHPCIARLLDGGTTDDGQPFLVMEHVAGTPIDAACDAHWLSIDERLRLFLRVCDAVHHAHKRLVVHRDLKPSNVLVDDAFAPHLLDFGIAKVLAEEAESDVLRTLPGERLLTPSYASPEQVRGDTIGVASDVYSLGVVLYELLAGASPYGAASRTRADLERAVLEKEPEPPSAAARRGAVEKAAERRETPASLSRRLKGDLDRIVLEALRKDPDRRYESAAALADEIERHRSGRPVRARGDSTLYRVGRFARRNKALVGALGAALVLGLVAAGVWVEKRIAEKPRLDAILRLADMQRLQELEDELPLLWPARRDAIAPLEGWIDRAEQLTGRRDLHAFTLEHASELGLGDLADRWMRERLTTLLAGLDALAADDRFGRTLTAARARLEAARSIDRLSIEEHRAAWDAAVAALRDDPRFRGIDLAPQVGLVPLGADPASGLQEFCAIETGSVPARGADGKLALSAANGIVLVLVPGGEFTLGAQAGDVEAPGYDSEAKTDEGRPRPVAVDAFFVAKHEMTQEQWARVEGVNPSEYVPGYTFGKGDDVRVVAAMHPVERMSQPKAIDVLRRVGLALPTEAQWEYAARAGTTARYYTGADERTLDGAANLADRFARDHGGAPLWSFQDWLDDGHTVHAPVGTYRPNAFGLHDVLGNVWEWTLDRYAPYADAAPAATNRSATAAPRTQVVTRGGGFFSPPTMLRVSVRYPVAPAFISHSLGVRPVRALDR